MFIFFTFLLYSRSTLWRANGYQCSIVPCNNYGYHLEVYDHQCIIPYQEVTRWDILKPTPAIGIYPVSPGDFTDIHKKHSELELQFVDRTNYNLSKKYRMTVLTGGRKRWVSKKSITTISDSWYHFLTSTSTINKKNLSI